MVDHSDNCGAGATIDSDNAGGVLLQLQIFLQTNVLQHGVRLRAHLVPDNVQRRFHTSPNVYWHGMSNV